MILLSAQTIHNCIKHSSTLSTANEKKLTAAEQWICRRMLRVRWKERRTNESIFEEIGEAPGLLPQVVKTNCHTSVTPAEKVVAKLWKQSFWVSKEVGGHAAVHGSVIKIT